jgi:stage II sporulation protein D
MIDMGDKWAFVRGRGFGHGVGMCQCGAEGMARQGKTAQQILSYYYPGSSIVRVYKK